jgi:aerotaxis receptor
MSGYTKEELIGQPHYILRHPDMPAVAFKGLWDDMAAGKPIWRGYVKNLRKDGRYYWVFANAVANIRDGKVVGYTSVRRKPSRTKVVEAEALYKTLK